MQQTADADATMDVVVSEAITAAFLSLSYYYADVETDAEWADAATAAATAADAAMTAVLF